MVCSLLFAGEDGRKHKEEEEEAEITTVTANAHIGLKLLCLPCYDMHRYEKTTARRKEVWLEVMGGTSCSIAVGEAVHVAPII